MLEEVYDKAALLQQELRTHTLVLGEKFYWTATVSVCVCV